MSGATMTQGITGNLLYWTSNLARLTIGILRDPNVPSRAKWRLAFAGVYLVIPIDLVPEKWFTHIGYIDDALVLLTALRSLLADTDEEIAQRHWDGRPRDLQRLRSALIRWDDKVRLTLRNLIARLIGNGSGEMSTA
ncbi:MAG: DUF1232 domain-containing protein [Deltaproteobacteria bacterium]|nr:DUF1232 domain-containing protein [Deltaproteobacteria bacterium]